MMLGVDDEFPEFEVVGVKPGFENPEENGESAFEALTNESFAGQWTVWFFYPKDFTGICGSEVEEFARMVPAFEKRNAVVLSGSSDNEFCKLAWRRERKDANKADGWAFADMNGSLIDGLGIREDSGVAYRTTYIVDPEGVIQHVSSNPLRVGRNPQETLRLLDALQSGEGCLCNRPVDDDFPSLPEAA